jgi:hypothetical protein
MRSIATVGFIAGSLTFLGSSFATDAADPSPPRCADVGLGDTPGHDANRRNDEPVASRSRG